MKYQTKLILAIVLSLLLLAEMGFVTVKMVQRLNSAAMQEQPTEEPTQLQENPDKQEEPTSAPNEESQPEETAETAAAVEVEQLEQWYTLSFAGDCTMGSTADTFLYESSYIQTVGDDYGYPFRNVYDIFSEDDFTIINLEGPLTNDGAAASKRFAFRGKPEYVQCLTGSSVEAVTLANNHSEDYGTVGYQNTAKALQDAGVAYVEKNKTTLFTTIGGLKVGLYADTFNIGGSAMKKAIADLRNQGAEVVICAFHWGTEGSYRPTGEQEYAAHLAIEYGADIVYGHHPHVLQKMETYKGGIIMYSLGNFSFGGSTFPKDYDSAVVQVQVIRGEDGKIRMGDTKVIPVLISSASGQNNYQPTPCREGSTVYNRILSKLDGSFTGPDLVVDYSVLDGTEPTETTQPEETTKPTEDTQPSETTAPTEATNPTTPTTGGGEGGGDTGGGAGGDTGGGGAGGDTGGGAGGDTGGGAGGDTGGGAGGGIGEG